MSNSQCLKTRKAINLIFLDLICSSIVYTNRPIHVLAENPAMALVPVTRNIPIERSPVSYFQPSWQLGEWNNFMSPQQMMPMIPPPPMPSMEKAMQEMNQQMVQMQAHMNKVMTNFQRLFPTGFEQPLQNDMQNSYVTDPEGNQRFRLTFDVRSFQPEELDIRTNDQTLSVYAVHHEQGPNGRYQREYRRTILLPPGVKPEGLQSVLSPEGVLTIEGPVSGKRLTIQQAAGPVITPIPSNPGSTFSRMPQGPAPIITLPTTPASTLNRSSGQTRIAT